MGEISRAGFSGGWRRQAAKTSKTSIPTASGSNEGFAERLCIKTRPFTADHHHGSAGASGAWPSRIRNGGPVMKRTRLKWSVTKKELRPDGPERTRKVAPSLHAASVSGTGIPPPIRRVGGAAPERGGSSNHGR